MAKEIIEVTTEEELKFLYNNWAMTWEGLVSRDFQKALRGAGTEESKGYLVKGSVMNKICKLKGSNAYKDDLNIFAIYPYKGIAMFYGARWMTDIIDNNSKSSHYKPFK